MDEALINYIRKKCSEYKSDKLLPLVMPTFGEEEILEALDSMTSMQVTMGRKVRQFEGDFSKYLGSKYSTMVNSGSSANLLALSILSNPTLKNRIKPGDEIIVPAVTWSTTVFPVINIGARPVLVDVDEDYQIDIERVKEMLSAKTKAIIPVHLLGNVCDMKAIMDLASDRKLFVVEDTCEALGSEYGGKKVGTFSDFSTFSFYFSHHITTVEGGMLCTSDPQNAELSRIMRAHGYIRDSMKKQEYIDANPDIDPRFLFVNIGYNMRPTDLAGAFGLHQLGKLGGFISKRREIAAKLLLALGKYEEYLILPREKKGTRHSWFAFPITVREGSPFKCAQLMAHLEKCGVETRPVVGGNLAEQPAFRHFDHRTGDLKNAKYIMKNAFYFGIHPNIDNETIEKVCLAFEQFFSSVKK